MSSRLELNGRILDGIFKLANPKHGPPTDAFASTNVLQLGAVAHVQFGYRDINLQLTD